MKRFAAGLAASVLATSATVFVFTGTAFATSPTCTATGDEPFIGGVVVGDEGKVNGYGEIECTQKAKANYTLTTKLWRNNGDGTYSSWSSTDTQKLSNSGAQETGTTCRAGTGTLQWHIEAIISWKVYNGSSLVASGTTPTTIAMTLTSTATSCSI
jgi:hypothetical protein